MAERCVFFVYDPQDDGSTVVDAIDRDMAWVEFCLLGLAEPDERNEYRIEPVTASQVDDMRDEIETLRSILERVVNQYHGSGDMGIVVKIAEAHLERSNA